MRKCSFELTGEQRLLCCVAADAAEWQMSEFPELWNRVAEEEAWRATEEHELTSLTGATLDRSGTDAPPRWRHSTEAMRARLRLYMDELDRVAAALAREGIPLVALKNAGIARGIYHDLAGCPMGDIDALVSRKAFRRAHEIMKRLGFQLGDRSPFELHDIGEAERHGGAEYTFRLPDGAVLWFELQWRPVSGRWLQPDQEPPADALIARSIAIPGSAARLLCPEDNLLQVCLHTAKHSYVRAPGFRLHTDVDRIVRRCPIDWERFIGDVKRCQVRTAVYFSLLLPAELLRTPVPEMVLARLRPTRWKEAAILRSLRRAGLFHPRQHKWSKVGYIIFNLLLYDSLAGIMRAVFPSVHSMKQRYGFSSSWALPWFYLQRCAELLLKRAKT